LSSACGGFQEKLQVLPLETVSRRIYFDDIAWYFFILLHPQNVLEDGEGVTLTGLDVFAYFIISDRGVTSRACILVLLNHV